MQNIKIRKKLIRSLAAGITIVFLATGCSNKQNIIENDTNNELPTVENNIDNEPENNNKEFDNFKTEQEEVNNIISTEGIDAASKVWSNYFIDGIDMIFYGKEYKDTLWSDLNPEAQAETIDCIVSTTNTIKEKNPNWEENLGTIRNFSVEIYYNILNHFKNLVGEEKYDALKEFANNKFNLLKEYAKNTKNKLSEYYQEYKNKTR